MQAVILAAGKGVRMKPLTNEIPKCMVKLKGKPILERIMENMIEAGVNEIILVVGYKKEIVEKYFGNEFKGAKVKYVVQEEAKGTAHAAKMAEKEVYGEFLISNSDVLLAGQDYKKAIEGIGKGKADGIIIARESEEPWKYGVLKVKGIKVEGIIEKPARGKEPGNLVNAGVYVFKKDFMQSVKETKISERGEFEIVDSIKDYISKGKKVEARVCGKFVDVSSIEDVKAAEEKPESEMP